MTVFCTVDCPAEFTGKVGKNSTSVAETYKLHKLTFLFTTYS